MRKCVVIGSSGFIGYELVCQLMENNDVTAVEMSNSNESDVISEEKIFSIGRNSQVKFVDEKQFVFEDEEYDSIFICHFFDELKLRGASSELNLSKEVIEIVRNNSKEIICLVSSTKELAKIEMKLIGLLQDKKDCITFIEIPSVYGPWEPSNGLIHELIVSELGKRTHAFKNLYGPNEIIYIEDVVKAIIEISEKELKENRYLITAKDSLFLPEQVELTGIQELINEIKVVSSRNVNDATPFLILNPVSINNGIQKQKQQIQQYFHLY